MNHQTTHTEHQFDIWLDAFVAGRSTPASRAAADSVSGDIRDSARQFHELAHGAERSPTLPPFAPIWEDFMHSQSIGTAADLVSNGAARSVASRPSPLATASHPAYRGARWHVALNMALTLLLIAVIGGGVWRATGGFGGDGADWQSAFAPDTRVWTPEASEATPEPEEERALLPMAEECNVEPLTVDDVLWYIDDPLGATMSQDMDQSATPDSNMESAPMEPTVAPAGYIVDGEVVPATPGLEQDPLVASPPPVFTPGPASPEQLAAIAEIQREWMACVLAESPFQRWALESPSLVLEQVMPLIPTFASEEEARRILEAVEAGGKMEPSDDFWNQPGASYVGFPPDGSGFPTNDTISIIDPATAESWTLDGRTITTAYTSHHSFPNGEVVVTQTELTVMGTPIANSSNDQPMIDSCFAYEFTWFPERSQVLVSSIPTCG